MSSAPPPGPPRHAGHRAARGRDAAAPRRGATIAGDVLAGGLPLLVYGLTMAPTVYGLDSAELTTGAFCLGIVHAPGSPAYLLLGHGFAALPVGDVGYRLNLLSAVAGALTALLLARVITRLTRSRPLAVAAAWCAAFSYYIWIGAVAAELYALHAAFVALFLLLVLRWRARGRRRDLWLLAAAVGIGAGNHLATVLLVPGLAWLALTGRRSALRPAAVPLVAIALGLAGAGAMYAYLPWRDAAAPPLNYARQYWDVDLTTLRGIVWMVSARMFAGRLFAVPAAELPAQALHYATALWSNFLGLGLLLGGVGLAADAPRRPALHVGLGLLFAGHLAFYLSYDVADRDLMLGPTFLVWAIWMALGARALCTWAAARLPRDWAIPAPTLLALLAGTCLLVNYRRVDLSADWSARRRGEQILAALPADAAYLGTWRDAPLLEYLQIVEARRPDVQVVNVLFGRERAAAQAAEMLRLGRPVFTSDVATADLGHLALAPVDACDCYRLSEPLAAAPAPGSGAVCWAALPPS